MSVNRCIWPQKELQHLQLPTRKPSLALSNQENNSITRERNLVPFRLNRRECDHACYFAMCLNRLQNRLELLDRQRFAKQISLEMGTTLV